MSAFETLQKLVRGERVSKGLLHTCRFEGMGSEAYGEEAIVARFRAAPSTIGEDAMTLRHGHHLTVLAADQAWFADLSGENIARIWAVGPDEHAVSVLEGSVCVPFDADLTQSRGDVMMTVSDHPSLSAEAVDQVVSLGRQAIAGIAARRARAFAVRAFGTAREGAALFAVYRLPDDTEIVPGFAMAIAAWGGGTDLVVHDRAGAATLRASRWTPQVGG